MASDVLCAFNAIIYSHSNDKLVEVENELQQLYTEHRNNVTLNEALFERIKSVYNNRPATLTTEQNRLLDDIYTGFVRAGANLKGNEREEYRKLSKKLTLLSLKFQENIIKDTDGFTLLVTREEDIEGLPADLVETAGKSAEESGKEGWLFTLHRPSYLPFITFCKNRELRRQMETVYSENPLKRASLCGVFSNASVPRSERITLPYEPAGLSSKKTDWSSAEPFLTSILIGISAFTHLL